MILQEIYKRVHADHCTNALIDKKRQQFSVEWGLSARIGHPEREDGN
jgi:hypothetical protein